MKYIPLRDGYYAVIDDDDFRIVSQHRWHLDERPSVRAKYASTFIGYKKVYMHRLIAKPPVGQHIDHIDGDGLNNRRSNIRFATRSQNLANRGKNKNNTTGFKGVFHERRKFSARLEYAGRLLYLGSYRSPVEAAVAYDAKARELHGQFARTNF